MERGEIYWVDFGIPIGSEPGYRRPAVILQSNTFNQTRIGTTICAVLTSNLDLLEAPGNLLVERTVSGLSKDSVLNISQNYTVNKESVEQKIGRLPDKFIGQLDASIRLVLDV